MPFPIDEKYIVETECNLKVKFPIEFKNLMMRSNGGELNINGFEFKLYPFFDKSDKKRIIRTCNHIGLETQNARKWINFPKKTIAISSDGYGNQLIFTHNGNGVLSSEIFLWNHENGEIKKFADSINIS